MDDEILKANRLLAPDIEADLVPFNWRRESVLEDADRIDKQSNSLAIDGGLDLLRAWRQHG
jgi:hypothetical protein